MKKKKRRQVTDFFDDKNEVEAERSVSSGSNKLISMLSRKLTRIIKDLDGIWLQTARFRPIFASV